MSNCLVRLMEHGIGSATLLEGRGDVELMWKRKKARKS